MKNSLKHKRWFTEADTSKEFIDKYVCKQVNEFQFDPQTPKYRIFPDMCKEHSGNTCCLHKDVQVITSRVQRYKDEGFHVSPKCFDLSKQIQCSVCDSDIGVHKKRGLCADFCYTWYDFCMSDYFVVRGAAYNNSLDFPKFDDLPHLVKPLYEIVSDVEEFCERMGFPVFEEPSCYNGVPVASTRNLNRKIHWQDMFTWPTNKHRLDWNTTQIVIFLFRNPEIYKPLGKAIGIVIVIMVLGYVFNRWQMSLRTKAYVDEEAEIKKRIKDMVDRQQKREKLLRQMGVVRRQKKKHE